MADLPPPVVGPAWRERITALAGALGVEPRRLVAGLAVTVVVAAVVITIAFKALAGAPPPPELTLPQVAPPSASPAAAGPVYVHVAGAVTRPGVYRLPAGARVADALKAAGGPADGAQPERLNLAAKVIDGQRVYVPRVGEAPPPEDASGGADQAGQSGPLDLNAATAEQLERLPGIGPALAKAIVDHRARHGPFRSVEGLLDVRGIGDAKLAEIREHVRAG